MREHMFGKPQPQRKKSAIKKVLFLAAVGLIPLNPTDASEPKAFSTMPNCLERPIHEPTESTQKRAQKSLPEYDRVLVLNWFIPEKKGEDESLIYYCGIVGEALTTALALETSWQTLRQPVEFKVEFKIVKDQIKVEFISPSVTTEMRRIVAGATLHVKNQSITRPNEIVPLIGRAYFYSVKPLTYTTKQSHNLSHDRDFYTFDDSENGLRMIPICQTAWGSFHCAPTIGEVVRKMGAIESYCEETKKFALRASSHCPNRGPMIMLDFPICEKKLFDRRGCHFGPAYQLYPRVYKADDWYEWCNEMVGALEQLWWQCASSKDATSLCSLPRNKFPSRNATRVLWMEPGQDIGNVWDLTKDPLGNIYGENDAPVSVPGRLETWVQGHARLKVTIAKTGLVRASVEASSLPTERTASLIRSVENLSSHPVVCFPVHDLGRKEISFTVIVSAERPVGFLEEEGDGQVSDI